MRDKWIVLSLLLGATLVPVKASQHPKTSSAESREFASRVWQSQDGLPENRIQAISESPDGYLWVGTASGLVRFDGARFVVYNRSNTPAFSNDSVHVIYSAPDSSLWIGTDGGGLIRLRDGTFQSFGEGQGLSNGFVKAVHQDRAGRLWATTAHGFFYLNESRFVRVTEPKTLPVSAFWEIEEKGDGRLQVRSILGWYEVRNGSLAGEPVKRGATPLSNELCANREPHSVEYRDHLGDLWAAGTDGGLVRFHDCAETTFRSPGTLPGDMVTAIWEDREHSLWIGTEDGLLRLSRTTLSTLDQRDGLSENDVLTTFEDREGVIWITTVNGKVFRLVDGRIVPFPLPKEIADAKIRTVFRDSRGSVFLSMVDMGFARITDGRVYRYNTDSGLRSNLVNAFLEGRQGDVWIATSSGLSHWDGNTFRTYYLGDGLVYGWVRVLAEDRNGDLLIGTDAGVSRFHEGKFVPDDLLIRAGKERIHAIHVDSSGTIWLGTRGAGLIRIGNGSIARVTTKTGLLSDSIYQILEDSGARLWMSSPTGVFSASLRDLNSVAMGQSASVAVSSYGLVDGMPSTQMNGIAQPAGAVMPDGRLIFPSVKGLVIIDPRHVPVDRPSPVHIEAMVVDDVPVSLAGPIVVPPGHRKLVIDFTACNLLSADSLSFRYRLRGLSDNWSVATKTRSAQYSNLPPGDYTFEVIAQDGAIPEGISQAAIGLNWQPHFYQTWWFYGVSALLLGGVIMGAVSFYANQQRMRYNLRLEERASVARDMHDTLIQGCVGASTLLEAAVGCAVPEAADMTEFLDRARIQLRLTLDEARQALRDLRHDAFANGLEGALEDLSTSVRDELDLPVDLTVEGSPAQLPEGVSRNLLLVAREAIRNAVAHADPTEIRVSLSFVPTHLSLEIRDNGCGFVRDNAHCRATDHFGITGMRERMEQMGGSFELQTAPGGGTSIVAVLPL